MAAHPASRALPEIPPPTGRARPRHARILHGRPVVPPDAPASAALAIDNDDEVRTSLRLVPQPERIRVLGVATGSAALSFVARERFDLVFLDVHLAGEHGLALLPALCRRCPGAAIIVITGRAPIPLAAPANWRGNLRRRSHAFESAVAVCDETCMRLGPERFNLESAAARAALRPIASGDDVPLDVLEFDHVARVIARSSSMEVAAQSLGIAAPTLRRMRAATGVQ